MCFKSIKIESLWIYHTTPFSYTVNIDIFAGEKSRNVEKTLHVG